jgi:hypothetical protein
MMGVVRKIGLIGLGLRRFPRCTGLLLLVSLLSAGCQRVQPINTQSLDTAGMGYGAVTQLKALKITEPEVAQIATARQAGLTDEGCVQVMQIYTSRKQLFDAGDAIAGLLGAGASENLVIKLARLNQLGLGAGELEAMRLAGLSDDILLAVAQHHAAGEAVLSGASLAGMKNLGMGSSTLLELAERGVPDSSAAQIMGMRRHGAKDAQILKEFAGS